MFVRACFPVFCILSIAVLVLISFMPCYLRLDSSLTQLCRCKYIYWLILLQLHVSAFIGHLQYGYPGSQFWAFDFFQGILSGCHYAPSPIAAVQFGTLPPCSLVHCRRTVWYIAAVRFGSSSSIATPAPLVIDLTQRDRRIVWYIAAVQFGTLPPYSLVHCRRNVW